jgi:hypothetical protein
MGDFKKMVTICDRLKSWLFQALCEHTPGRFALCHRNETATGSDLDVIRSKQGIGGIVPPEPRPAWYFVLAAGVVAC